MKNNNEATEAISKANNTDSSDSSETLEKPNVELDLQQTEHFDQQQEPLSAESQNLDLLEEQKKSTKDDDKP